ncbi:doublecortin domain-containing protein 2B [Arapaima gigas]
MATQSSNAEASRGSESSAPSAQVTFRTTGGSVVPRPLGQALSPELLLLGPNGSMAASRIAPPPAKSVLVFRNGDPFHTGRKLLVRQRQGATMEAFLNEVTEVIKAPVAVRSLHTPRHGHRVCDLQELQSGARYVAVGFERFKNLDYLSSGPRRPAVLHGDALQVSVAMQRLNIHPPPRKWNRTEPLPCVIHVFRNGDVLTPPLRFILPKSLRRELEQVLRLVSEKASLLTGAVRRLCTLEGWTVASVEELHSGQYYVAVGTEKFKKLPYVELLVSKAETGPRNQLRNGRLPKQYETRKPLSVPQDRFSDSALLASPEADARRVRSTGDEAGSMVPPEGSSSKEDSLFYAKPVGVRKGRVGNRPPHGGESDVFKGRARKRREEMQGAQEVAEDEDTAVELPVDQRAAETVEDEAISETPRGHQGQAVADGDGRDDASARLSLMEEEGKRSSGGLGSPWQQQSQEMNHQGSRPVSRKSRSSPVSSEAEQTQWSRFGAPDQLSV